MPKFFLYLIFLLSASFCSAQDTLILISGKTMVVKSVEISEYLITYQSLDSVEPGKTPKIRKMDPERVFAVHFADGHEHVVFETDTLDPQDFKVEEMRRFIKGEQDAREFYHNRSPKYLGLAVGASSAVFAFYGLIGPPLFSTVVGRFSPNVDKKMTYSVSGSALESAGIPEGEVFNNVAGKTPNPVFKGGSELKINNTPIVFQENTPLDTAVEKINQNFKHTFVHANNVNGRLNLYRSTRADFLQDPIYREGFEKRVRDVKIRSGMLAGLIGFVAASVTYTFVFHKD